MADELETPVPEAPAAPVQPQASIPVADLSGALVNAYNQIVGSQPRPQASNPLDHLTEEQRQQLNTQFLTNPLEAARYVQQATQQATEQRIYQQAIPLIQTAANNIVESFKMKKSRSDPYFSRIEPLFDRLMVGVDTSPLVNMNQATREHELELRWASARSDILDRELKRIRPEPTLLSSGSSPAPVTPKITADPWYENMKRQYNFTDEQMAEIEAAGER